MLSSILSVGLLTTLALGAPSHNHGTQAVNAKSSLTFLFQNNLNASDTHNHVGAILLDPMNLHDAREACQEIGESLLSRHTIAEHWDDFSHSFAYLFYSWFTGRHERAHIRDGVVSFGDSSGDIAYSRRPSDGIELPVLCTQTSTGNATSSPNNQMLVHSGSNAYVGYRDQKSFRFLGIPYADTPQRFEYSTLYSEESETIQATEYGSQCSQASGGSEDCLFLNIQTPYIPKQGDRKGLKPVMFWIHGGGFTGGSGADPLTDGGNLASREDIVVVTINYRLSTLGFLAVPGTDVRGNYGIADQIVALEWTVKNIAEFGGDPNRITIIGESAGAGSVRVLLGSPPALGKFQGAVAMSNLGGGVGLGLESDYATTYSSYLTVEESYERAGQQIFSNAGCTQDTVESQIKCLEDVPASELVGMSDAARYVVQDGHFVNTEELILNKRNHSTAHVPVIFGIAANDGASFATYPKSPVSSELEGIQKALGIDEKHAQSVIDSGVFPYYDTGNVTWDSFNVSQRVKTDIDFRCIDQATVYAGTASDVFPNAYFYQMERTYGGYDPNNLGGPPVTPGYPNGNPNLPYFRQHGADLPWVFGTLTKLRGELDLYSTQLTSGYFAEFVKSGQPNPPVEYLIARGYRNTLEAVVRHGPWEKVDGERGPIQQLDYPSIGASFQDLVQCQWLGYPISYYLDGDV